MDSLSLVSEPKQTSAHAGLDRRLDRFSAYVKPDLVSYDMGNESAFDDIAQYMTTLHSQLGTLPEYQSAMQSVSLESHESWRSHSLHHDEKLKAGFLRVEAGQSLPLHDHPNSFGIMLVISGRLQLKQFTRVIEPYARLARLAEHSDVLLEKGDCSILCPVYGNVHTLQSFEQPVIVLDLIISNSYAEERHWYVPVMEANTADGEILATEIAKSAQPLQVSSAQRVAV
ncbi:MAG: hypothetical protein JKY93_04175 [Gammaproteobacteria bacterium]|nr:hypothetical protein [Gammaproteobacteria bacterium]